MSAAFISFRKNKNRRVKSKSLGRRLTFGPASLSFVTVLLFSLLSLLYLAQSNQISTKGYAIRELEQKKDELVAENERLQVEAARLQAISMINDKAADLKMEKVKKVDYLASFGTASLAAKK
jgi:hypothetical protein